MSDYGGGPRAGVIWTMIGALAGVAGVIVALLAAEGVFSSSGSSSSTTTSVQTSTNLRHLPPLSMTTAVSTLNLPPGTPPWSGDVSLEVNRDYALDGLSIKALYSCTGCLRVGDYVRARDGRPSSC